MPSFTSLSPNCPPIKPLKAKTVFCEFTTTYRLAGKPTRRSSCLVNATTEGVVRAPSEFSMTRGVLSSMTETLNMGGERRETGLRAEARKSRDRYTSQSLPAHTRPFPASVLDLFPFPQRFFIPQLIRQISLFTQNDLPLHA